MNTPGHNIEMQMAFLAKTPTGENEGLKETCFLE